MYLADYGRCKIKLDCDCEPSDNTPQFNCLKGQITFFLLNYRIAFQDFRIHLQGTVSNGFEEIQFMPEEHEPSSPFIYHFIRKHQPTQPEYCLQGKGRGPHEFKFQLSLKTQSFPSSFHSHYGTIQYKLVVSSIFDNTISIAAEKIVNLKGYLNLSLDPRVNTPFCTRKKCKSSLFSNRHVLTAILGVNRRGFLPGEILVFELTCKNCVHVVEMKASLIQKIVYSSTKNKSSNKINETILDHSELSCRDYGQDDREIHWAGGLLIPENLMPSFTPTKKSLEIIYVLRFVVETGEGQAGLKGETPIVIGSTRGTSRSQNSSRQLNSHSNPGPSHPSRDDSISYQFSANFEDPAILPPAYSTLYLYSRCSSLETLPPTYEEALDGIRIFEDEEHETSTIRPRRNSNVM